MKKIVLLLTALCVSTALAVAQKYAFVDTEYILNNIPSYKAAKEQLDKASQDWQKGIEAKQDEIYKAVKDLAPEGGYAVIFDTSSGPSMIYTNPRYDISDEVLQKLGYKN